MHLGYLASLYPYASDTYVRNEINALRDAGWQISTFAIRRPSENMLVDEQIRGEASKTQYLLSGNLLKLFIACIWTIVTRPMRLCGAAALVWQSHAPGIKNRLKQFAYVIESCRLARLLLQKKVSHLHNHVAENSATVAMLASHISGVPYSMTVHGPGIFSHSRAWGLGEKVKCSAFTVCITDFCRSQCMIVTPAEYWNHLHIVHCGLGKNFIAYEPPAKNTSNNFVSVGRLCAEKGQMILLEAAYKLAQSGHSFELIIIGDGPMRAELERQRDQWNLSSCVHFIGWQSSDKVRETISNARCLVVSSFAEGLPMVIMEALALRRPVITTCIAGIPELVENAVNGWLVPPGNVDALATAMKEMLAMPPEQLHRMGAAGAKRVRERHNAETEAGKLAELFKKYGSHLSVNNTAHAEVQHPIAESLQSHI